MRALALCGLVGLAAPLASACGGEGRQAAADAGGEVDASVDAARDIRDEVVYLAMIDRFVNGDPTNDGDGDVNCFQPGSDLAYHGGDLQGARQRLDYLQELGVTTLWSTPLYENTFCGSHGYWPAFAAQPRIEVARKLGGAEAVDALVEELHARGMYFMLDMVVNHAGYRAPVVGEKPHWFHDPDSCNGSEITCELAGLPDFAQEKPEVATYLTDTSTLWATRFEVDGIRMDTAKHVPLGYFRDNWIPALDEARPDLYTIAEVFDESGPEALQPFLRVGFDSAFHFPLRRVILESVGAGSSLDEVAGMVRRSIEQLGLEDATRMTTFLSNHDLPRWIDAAIDRGMGEDEAVERYLIAMALTVTLPGIPQLYAGDELCMIGDFPLNRQLMPDWAFAADTRRGEHEESKGDGQRCWSATQDLLRVRAEQAPLRRGRYEELWSQGGGEPVYAFMRAEGQERVIVVVNASATESSTIPIPLRGNPRLSPDDRLALGDGTTLRELYGRGAPETLTVSDGHLPVSLPAFSVGIYRVE